MKVIKAVRKPNEVECVQWTGINCSEIEEFCGCENTMFYYYRPEDADTIELKLAIITHPGRVEVGKGDFIIKEANGTMCLYDEEAFEATYDIIG